MIVVRRLSAAMPIAVLLLAGGTIARGPAVHAQTRGLERVVSELEPEIRRTMLEGRNPSTAVALVVGDRVLWTGAYGYSNIWARTPATPSTVYHYGSTFKTMSTLALLQQMEGDRFDLDDPVGAHLREFSIRDEDPRRPVTFRHLLTHTSGMPTIAGAGNVSVWSYAAPPRLEDYLAASLRVDGPPLEAVRYSNMAYALVGYLVGELSGVPFRQYIEERIWGELGMTSTAFEPTPDMEQRLAVPYVIDEATGALVPVARTKSPRWPAGFVYGTVEDMAQWLIVNLNEGEYRGTRLVSRETMDLMHTRQYDQFQGLPVAEGGNETSGYGLTWLITYRDGKRYFSHSGTVPGYTAFIAGSRDERVGVVLLTNGHQQHRHLDRLSNLAIRLLEEEFGGASLLRERGTAPSMQRNRRGSGGF